eukprot:scaffold163782_cov32-Tisochrysis_lutea.AAC.5
MEVASVPKLRCERAFGKQGRQLEEGRHSTEGWAVGRKRVHDNAAGRNCSHPPPPQSTTDNGQQHSVNTRRDLK